MRLILRGVLPGVVALSLGAQTLPAQRVPQVWDGNGLVTLDPPRVTFEWPHQASKTWFLGQGLSAPSRCHFFQGAYWVYQPQERGGKPGLALLKSVDGASRETVAWVARDLPEGRVVKILPLPEERFLLVSRFGFFRDGHGTFLAIAKKDSEGTLHIDRLLPVDLGCDLFKTARSQQDISKGPKILFVIGWMGDIIPAGEHLVFVHQPFGHFSVLDLKDFKSRFVRLFENIKLDSYINGEAGLFERAILGVQPRKNGHLLIASRSEEAVLKARALEHAFGTAQVTLPPGLDSTQQQKRLRESLDDPMRKDLQEAAQRDGAARYPEVLWWDLDPQTGRLTREPVPTGAPSELASRAHIQRFTFRLDPNEQVKVGP